MGTGAAEAASGADDRGALRRLTKRAGLLLLLGAITNVAVAWGCARWCSFGLHRAPKWQPTSADQALWSASAPTSIQHLNVAMERTERSTRGLRIRDLRAHNADARKHGTDVIIINGWWMSVDAGWPLLSMTGDLWRMSPRSGGHPTANARTPTALLLGPGWGGLLPLLPRMPEFAANTVFYAAILTLPLGARRALRAWGAWRRSRHGLCPGCAYPVGESNVCTECGRMLPSPSR